MRHLRVLHGLIKTCDYGAIINMWKHTLVP